MDARSQCAAQQLAELQSEFAIFTQVTLPGMAILAERGSAVAAASVMQREVGLVRDDLRSALSALHSQVIEAGRAHTNAAVEAATVEFLRATRAHTEAAVSATAELLRSDTQDRINAAVGAAIDAVLVAQREHTDASVASGTATVLLAAQEHAEAAASAALVDARADSQSKSDRVLAMLRRELHAYKSSSAAASRAEGVVGGGVPVAGRLDLDPAFYAALEDRFRGESSQIIERQRAYVPLVVGCSGEHPVLDLGCGRGEWLRVLDEAGVPALGVDSNPAFVDEVRGHKLRIVEGDLVAFLHGQPDSSAGAITMFQVVEHLPLAILIDVLENCVRVLRPGGLLIAETPNSLNLRVAATTFWLDPTHQRPLHPELLQFMALHVGFEKVDGLFMNELGDSAEGVDPAVRRLLEYVDGAGDFALLAWT